MRVSVFWLIILSVFSIFLFSISLAAQGKVIGLILLLAWAVGVVFGMRIFSHPKYAKYHVFVKG
jgi:mannose/fructose/N-acetylgalactosamine-specific phosphotransferase system component IID